jgi:hypothetical protein
MASTGGRGKPPFSVALPGVLSLAGCSEIIKKSNDLAFALNTLHENWLPSLNFSPASEETRLRAQAVETIFQQPAGFSPDLRARKWVKRARKWFKH